jgi:hypothetical protein
MLFADTVTHNDMHLHRYMYTHDDSLSTHPLLPGFTSVCPFLYNSTPSFYLLGDPVSFARGANTHPLLSLLCYQLFSPCCFTHPRHPTDQVTYLQRRHQQYQLYRLTQDHTFTLLISTFFHFTSSHYISSGL